MPGSESLPAARARPVRRVLVGAVLVGAVLVVVLVLSTVGATGIAGLVGAPARSPLVLGGYKFGACVGEECPDDIGPAGVDSYARWLGTDVLYGEDNVGDTYWDLFERGWPDSFRQWSQWRSEQPGRRLVLGVPFFVEQEPDLTQPYYERIAMCARGEFDRHYTALGQNLVAAGLGDTIVRIAWESHGEWAPWSYRNNLDDWRECWRRVAFTIKAAAPEVRTNWNVGDDNGGQRSDMIDSVNERGFDNFYPGDDAVDEIGIDTYDVPRVTDYDAMFGEHVGELGWFARMGQDRGKPLSFPEWGLWDTMALDMPDGSGDDVEYIERMHAWMTDPANNVAWACYFDVNLVGNDPTVAHQLQPDWDAGTVFPASSARFRELFGGS